MRKPLILVSNDDGYQAKGLSELVRFLRPLAHLVVLAPDSPRSGSSSCLSVGRDISLQRVHDEMGLEVWRSSGTPADCVKLAFYSVLGDRMPDMVVAGINHGDNASTNVFYSGTMGAVREGCLRGIPSMGFSLCDDSPEADFSPLEPYIQDLVLRVLARGLPPLVCLNVNFPAHVRIEGLSVATQARGGWRDEFVPLGGNAEDVTFWRMQGEFVDSADDDPLWDRHGLRLGYATVTPVSCDATPRSLRDAVERRLFL